MFVDSHTNSGIEESSDEMEETLPIAMGDAPVVGSHSASRDASFAHVSDLPSRFMPGLFIVFLAERCVWVGPEACAILQDIHRMQGWKIGCDLCFR